MKLLCDANVGRTIVRALTAGGHEVAEAAMLFRAATDEEILLFAVAHAFVLITCDRDFGDLVFGKGAAAPPAIIYIRFEPENVADIVPRLMPLLDEERLHNHMTVIGHDTDRRRAFPGKTTDNV